MAISSFQSILRQDARTGKRRRAIFFLAVLAGVACLGALARGAAGQEALPPSNRRHVLVISIDGLAAQVLQSPSPSLHIPNLLRLKREGSYAEAVVGVYPSVTYPAHTTIVTGRMPAEHGIYTNLSSRQAGRNPGDWFWFASAIKAPTLWDEARRQHLTTASVAWPVTVGAAIDWDVPEIWDPKQGEQADPLYLARFMNPLVAAELLTPLSSAPAGSDTDVIRTRLAVYLLTRHKPDLMLVHLGSYDEIEHSVGPEGPAAAATLQEVDADVGEILSAVKEAGLAAATDVFLVSDHGFMQVEREIRPNILLVKAGLLTSDKSGGITGGVLATVANGGSFFIYWPDGEDLRQQVLAALQPLFDQHLVWATFDPQALQDMGADPAAKIVLEAPTGAYFLQTAYGTAITARLEAARGAHGYLPFRKELETVFIAWGPDIRPGLDLHTIRMTSEGATILKAMGINDPQFGDAPPLQDIFK